jgi:hypothetical protein
MKFDCGKTWFIIRWRPRMCATGIRDGKIALSVFQDAKQKNETLVDGRAEHAGQASAYNPYGGE